MIKIVSKNGSYKQKVSGVAPIVMHEITTALSHLIRNEKTDKTQEKLMGFAAMLGIAQVFTKSEMLELLHDACEGKDPDVMVFDYFAKMLHGEAILHAQDICAIADAVNCLYQNPNQGPDKKPDLMC